VDRDRSGEKRGPPARLGTPGLVWSSASGARPRWEPPCTRRALALRRPSGGAQALRRCMPAAARRSHSSKRNHAMIELPTPFSPPFAHPRGLLTATRPTIFRGLERQLRSLTRNPRTPKCQGPRTHPPYRRLHRSTPLHRETPPPLSLAKLQPGAHLIPATCPKLHWRVPFSPDRRTLNCDGIASPLCRTLLARPPGCVQSRQLTPPDGTDPPGGIARHRFPQPPGAALERLAAIVGPFARSCPMKGLCGAPGAPARPNHPLRPPATNRAPALLYGGTLHRRSRVPHCVPSFSGRLALRRLNVARDSHPDSSQPPHRRLE